MALRHMKPQILQALRPLDIDSGKFQRAQYGYRVHSSMMTFAWAGKSVQDKIAELPRRRDRRQARRAHRFLMSSVESSYGDFVERQTTVSWTSMESRLKKSCGSGHCASSKKPAWSARCGRTSTWTKPCARVSSVPAVVTAGRSTSANPMRMRTSSQTTAAMVAVAQTHHHLPVKSTWTMVASARAPST